MTTRTEPPDPPEMVVAKLLKEMYPHNPDIVLGREARRIVERLRAVGYSFSRQWDDRIDGPMEVL